MEVQNPENWPLATKWTVTGVMCVVTVAMYTGSAFWSVCIDDAVKRFDISETVAQLGTSLFVVGFGLGPMVWSPLSEMPSVGRLKVYLWTAVIFIACQLPIPLSDNIAVILVCRFLTGFFCSPVLAVGGGTVADMFGPATIGYPMACWELATWGGSAVGPTFAGFTFDRFGYKGPMWELVFLGVLGLMLIICLIPETLPATILHHRAQRLRRGHPHKTFVTYSELQEDRTSLFATMRGLLVKALALNFHEPIVFVLNLYVALVFAIFFGMLESYPYVFKQEPYNFNTGQVGLVFLGIFAGGFVSMIAYFIFLWKHQDHCFDENGNITPEERLLPAIPSGLFVPLGLFWYGWTTHIHWIMPTLGGFFFGIGMFTIFMSMLSYLPDAYPSYAATVIAGNCLMRAGLAAAFPLFIIPYYELLGPGVTSSILGGLGVLFMPWPLYLFYRGHQLRMRSREARKDI
ncbi:major facilitator superfamily domain-containing protein [Neohortaea acidophila]|uniref:Major facilitator superfamily domain-containing protein n=1 Tax=Neohortaea acidophila TaxID=245834 RepID=A0A6A6PME6_9PEZI|nr:major facilitator superfamily domain-containing protein [Neohortaea acidophila]KAF2480986.1 major facilitator superfamily domain-containing protein [Neohortaea acidophila]